MGIGLYLDADPGTAVSESGLHTNDFLVALDGNTGGVIQRKLYLRNDNNTLYYYNIQLTVGSDVLGLTYLDDSLGYNWKLTAGNTQPLDEDWDLLTPPNTINMPNIGSLGTPDTTTFFPFWVRVEIPKNADVRTFTEIQFKLTAQEALV